MKSDVGDALRRGSILHIVWLACAVVIAGGGASVAGPDPCTESGAAATCSGNQSAGVSVGTNVTIINVQNLTSPITPAPGTPGIGLQVTAGGGLSPPALAVTVSPGSVVAAPPATSSILVVGAGGSGATGRDGSLFGGTGGAGGAGGAGNSVTVVTGAAASGSNPVAASSRAVTFGQITQLVDAAGKVSQATLEQRIRTLLQTSDDAKVLAACGGVHCTAEQARNLSVRAALIAPGNQPNAYTDTFGTTVGVADARNQTDAQLAVQLRGNIAIVQYLQNSPLPQEIGNRNGVVAGSSIGGNGGAGGIAATGGPGGNGGAGGTVSITNNGSIAVNNGTYVAGVMALSVGGNGGNGGPGGAPGAAGTGGAGGNVVVANVGSINTSGVGASGIFAQSAGGKGATPGGASNGTIGGAGGTVTVNQLGTITTAGYGAFGLFAQSLGGTGGNAVQSTVGNSSEGGTGGIAGSVGVTLAGSISTAGGFAHGIFASSVGGAGGIGGLPSGTGGSGGTAESVTINVLPGSVIRTMGDGAHAVYGLSQGGSGGGGATINGFWEQAGGGGNGGWGNVVNIVNNGTLSTSGPFAYGIFAQSLGGNGGYGGDAGGLFAQSGVGGGGALSREVSVVNAGSIVTIGTGSHGIFAQSVAGGGGDAGTARGFIALGGGGSEGAAQTCRGSNFLPGSTSQRFACNDAGAVNVANSGSIAVGGNFAYGIFGQSVGGGGGNGGGSAGLFAFGGTGGGGGNGGDVAITNSGNIVASGAGTSGVFGQSIGGGGGNGGNASSIGVGVQVAIGGSGGDGGFGSAVRIFNSGAVIAAGSQANGILAQSIGGGGGNSGDAGALGLSAFSLTIGGSGGGGGDGGAVVVTNNGFISATGAGSNGIMAQSVGGGGGSGGNAVTGSVFTAVQIGVAVGGSGGGGGEGHSVDVNNGGAVATSGQHARGIFAQSVGGGGGDGGDAAVSSSTAGSDGAPLSVSIGVAVGGRGDASKGGGRGGDVTVRNANAAGITTFGDRSHGIQAQSVGGGGGSGGSASATASVMSSPSSVNIPVGVGVGGSGGRGGDGGTVRVINGGSIFTAGNLAYGIFAQSIGGGGGDGGSAIAQANADPAQKSVGISVAVGGSGTGGGGTGGTVVVNSSGAITTLGNNAIAVLAQSVGGGGGTGGNADSSAAAKFAPQVSVGGSGSGGGAGGAVSVGNSGAIGTLGNNAYGVLAQSVGGGGGIGGGAHNTGNDSAYSLGVTVGGRGGSGGAGGTVIASNAGSIATLGAQSYGLFAQSVGGGGGIAGDASSGSGGQTGSINLAIGGGGGIAGGGGTVTIGNTGNISSLGPGAHGIFAQSVGGGGGVGAAGSTQASGTISLGAGLGGNGGASGSGNAVQVTSGGTILTEGNDAYGIFAQSVGGGGGAGVGDGGSAGVQGASRSIGISVGGGAGASGSGGQVSVAQTGSITTLGTQAFGILAQSVGGGGGVGGAGQNNTSGAVAVGGNSSGGGSGGNVAVSIAGSITTFGAGAHGIFGQSVGGGGGVGGDVGPASSKTMSFGIGATGAGGGAGNGGTVGIASSGTIATSGPNAYGILAQSVGGGGGYAGANNGALSLAIGSSSGGSGSGGTINVSHTGSIAALGADSHGIFAQSTGPNGAGNINVTVAGGSVIGGTASGAGIYLDGGNANTVTVGSGGVVSALSGQALYASNGNDVVNNAGTVIGNVRLGAGTNGFNNLPGGRFITASTIDLGSTGNVLSNAGIVSIGGFRNVATTNLSGQFAQSSGGVLGVDVAFGAGQRSDLLNVSGNASVSGFIRPTNLYLMPNQAPTILTATGPITNAGATTVNSPTITYGLDFNNIGGPGALAITVNSVNFAAPANLTGNQRGVANAFQSVYDNGGSPALAASMGWLVNLNANDYAATLDQLHPEAYLIQAGNALNTGMGFANALLSCHGFDGTYAGIREHSCSWVKGGGGVAWQIPSSTTLGFNETAYRVQVGTQLQVGSDWFVGLGAGYESANATAGSTAITANRIDVGATVKYVAGPLLLAAALDGGYTSSNNTRSLGLLLPGTSAYSNSFLWHFDAKLRAAYLLEAGNLYAKPMVDGDLIYAYIPAFSEWGAGPLSLNVNSMSNALFAATPAVEFGGTFFSGGDHYLRPRLVAGVTFLSENSMSVGASFAGAPASPFVTSSTFPGTIFKLSAGLDIISAKLTGGLDIRLQYDGQFAEGYQSHNGGAKFSMRF